MIQNPTTCFIFDQPIEDTLPSVGDFYCWSNLNILLQVWIPLAQQTDQNQNSHRIMHTCAMWCKPIQQLCHKLYFYNVIIAFLSKKKCMLIIWVTVGGGVIQESIILKRDSNVFVYLFFTFKNDKMYIYCWLLSINALHLWAFSHFRLQSMSWLSHEARAPACARAYISSLPRRSYQNERWGYVGSLPKTSWQVGLR